MEQPPDAPRRRLCRFRPPVSLPWSLRMRCGARCQINQGVAF
jgi:hypothetical protein